MEDERPIHYTTETYGAWRGKIIQIQYCKHHRIITFLNTIEGILVSKTAMCTAWMYPQSLGFPSVC